MNKIIISSLLLLRIMEHLSKKIKVKSVLVIAEKGTLKFEDTVVAIDCVHKNDFKVPLYATTIERLVKILSLLSDQPLTVSFKDSETFNVTIHALVV